MAISGWHPRYSTGIKLIDEQHQEIFLGLARIKTAVHMGGEGEDVGSLLDDFERLVVAHFAAEEDLMRRHEYPDLEPHRVEHSTALEGLREIRVRYAERPETLADLIATFVSGWLKHHLTEGDFKYVTFLKARNV